VARRTARGDVRVDGALLAVALILALIALALPDARAEAMAASVRGVLGPLVQVQARFEMARRVIATHDSTRAPADTLVLRALDATGLAAENTQLRALLSLGDRVRWGFIPGELVHPATLGESYSLLLSRGARDGVTAFSGVIAAGGVVGTVRSVDDATSVVLTWPHPDFRVSAMSADGDAAGIVGAHLGEPADRFLLEFRGVPFRAALDSGEVIVSSGAGGVFPRGVPVGVVLREIETSEGWSRTYLLRPAVHPADVGPVLVLRADRARLGVAEAYEARRDTAGDR
jgi:rod shape-determining protein MreC